jgi:hypothetical protein
MKYCGLDMGKKSSHFCVIDETRKIIKEGEVKNRTEELVRVFGKPNLQPNSNIELLYLNKLPDRGCAEAHIFRGPWKKQK